jgi:hypothetical protein
MNPSKGKNNLKQALPGTYMALLFYFCFFYLYFLTQNTDVVLQRLTYMGLSGFLRVYAKQVHTDCVRYPILFSVF